MLRSTVPCVVLAAALLSAAVAAPTPTPRTSPAPGTAASPAKTTGAVNPTDVTTPYVILAYAEQGMHFMNWDYSDICLQPPFSTLRAQVIRRGSEPQLVSSGVTVNYSIPGNTHSADKSNFWSFPQPLLGTPAPNVGLTGHRLSGTMYAISGDEWAVTGLPVTPFDDFGRENPYPLAKVTGVVSGQVVAQTRAVIAASTEINCSLCHNPPDISAFADILTDHDVLHGTDLLHQRPVLCASCHADASLNLPGQPGISTLSSAIHTAHAPRVPVLGLSNDCLACHPGFRTKHQRDNHSINTACDSCHGGMQDVGNPVRRPWVDLPRCDNCHQTSGSQYEQPGRLFKDSVGHGNVHCAACHGPPHAVNNAATDADNLQANLLQGHAGYINDCLVCHTSQPTRPFFHYPGD